MKLSIDGLRLSAQADGTWVGHADVTVDGVRWSGLVVVGKQAQVELRYAIADIRGDEDWHGTAGGYINHGCRCLECSDAHNLALKDHRKAKRQRGRCIDCPAKSRGWRCPVCEEAFRNRRKRKAA